MKRRFTRPTASPRPAEPRLLTMVRRGDIEKLRVVLNAGEVEVDGRFETLLHEAVAAGQAVVAKCLLGRHAAPNACDADGKTPFGLAPQPI